MKSQEQYDLELEQARARLPAAREALKGIPGVIDVLVGLKATDGLATEQVAYQVFVARKLPTADLATTDRIPRVVEGLPTDVIEHSTAFPESELLWGGDNATAGLFGASSGTFGAVALATATNTFAPAGAPLLLTNQHVAEDRGDVVGTGCMCNCCCCSCGSVGRVVDTRRTARLDAAIAVLDAGVRFTHAILGIGAVRGMAVAAIGMPVVKYGQTTGLTTGRIMQVNLPPFKREDDLTMTGQILVTPVAPSTDMSNPGDSGSVYVHSGTRQVVGLHHAGRGNDAIGCHMTTVAGDGVADDLRIEFPVMGTANAIPLGGMPVHDARPTLLDEVVALRRDLERTESGQRWLELMRLHSPEIQYLVNHHRPTQVAWQRSQGPAFVAHYLKSARDRAYRVPREIGGTRPENLIVAMAAVLQQHGSPALAQAITEHYLTALQCVDRAESAADTLANARRLAGA
jgi:hypothetical protein